MGRSRAFRRALIPIMILGSAILLAGLLFFMLAQPFEPVDDLVWLTKLQNEGWSAIPFVPAWQSDSDFYRPIAELLLKLCFEPFRFDPTPYRFVQFAFLLWLIWLCHAFLGRLKVSVEARLILPAFLIGSPFISGSLIWLSELPHIVVLVCFVGSLLALTSEISESRKLLISGVCFSIALLCKENGLALTALVLYFFPTSIRWRAMAAFAAIIFAYFGLRYLVLPSLVDSPHETVGYFFQTLSHDQIQNRFPGPHIAEFYIYNIVAQTAALWFRLTKWGLVISERYYEAVIQIISSTLILTWLWSRPKIDRAVLSILIIIALGGVVFSYAYARDRHLALPALSYGLLLVIAVDRISGPWRRAILATVWLAWSLQAAIAVRDVHRDSVDLVKMYRTNPEPIGSAPSDVWDLARNWAIQHATSINSPLD
jgi:hypothetical protein